MLYTHLNQKPGWGIFQSGSCRSVSKKVSQCNRRATQLWLSGQFLTEWERKGDNKYWRTLFLRLKDHSLIIFQFFWGFFWSSLFDSLDESRSIMEAADRRQTGKVQEQAEAIRPRVVCSMFACINYEVLLGSFLSVILWSHFDCFASVSYIICLGYRYVYYIIAGIFAYIILFLKY